ncbi:MAG: UDP-N-acetylenolpyruvoylglucosamine reductase [Nitrospirae bacterium GWC2_57_13]|jgi:UDP-N-acetylmuramate dehydrogenase|nr:MAG: UDP-N-acetylenolpyruvoylglucosamine reductase [Nitrospirae bacterium GWC1_57_7]OGW27236.1 MAG: UDP-N-acetylenolpyruvoylglucosamine reductase [Nitrospirae bacterium GWC2_57_13]OGW45777.1 MAG: UDP-N-acetylenolpyruvoylglucosamine reductase [Nitrospirae bacterium GWD2_57_8]HAR45142.1 UDP-N-acetylenolpyruvoylglucosamine reductase [Nitrospiraceae bacterium]
MEIADFRGELRRNELLGRHTSYRIGGPAELFAVPADQKDLAKLLSVVRSKGMPCLVLGGGTNLLVRDGGFRGVVICLERIAEIEIAGEYRSVGGIYTLVRAEAGAPLRRLLAYTLTAGLAGLEFATGIPGSVGGAVCMNAGTSAGETGDVVKTITMLSPEGEMIKKGGDEMEFRYRRSLVPQGHVVVEAQFALRRDEKAKVRERARKLMESRKQNQPWGFPCAGSVFKNPNDRSAGMLIEAAGLKGRKVGKAQISEKHANFIVNLGGAKAADVIALMDIARDAVLDMHGIRLEPEIKVVGED